MWPESGWLTAPLEQRIGVDRKERLQGVRGGVGDCWADQMTDTHRAFVNLQQLSRQEMMKTWTKAVAMRKEKFRIERYLRAGINKSRGLIEQMRKKQREIETTLRFLTWKMLWMGKSLRRESGKMWEQFSGEGKGCSLGHLECEGYLLVFRWRFNRPRRF